MSDMKNEYIKTMEADVDEDTVILQLRKEIEDLKAKNEQLKVDAERSFLNQYLVPNFYEKDHLAKSWSDEKWDKFKEFVMKWACTGEMNEIMEELMVNFDEGYETDEED